jgi:hypothetical protein
VGAILEVLVRTLGTDKAAFSIGSEGAPSVGERKYDSLTAAAEEVRARARPRRARRPLVIDRSIDQSGPVGAGGRGRFSGGPPLTWPTLEQLIQGSLY